MTDQLTNEQVSPEASQGVPPETGGPTDRLREEAIARLKRKREFGTDLLAYVLVNGVLVVIWALTSRGFFWPVFLIAGWGIGLVFHAWDTYARGPSEARIQREMDRIRR